MPKFYTKPPITEIFAASLAISSGCEPDELECSEAAINEAMSSAYREASFHSIIRSLAKEAGIAASDHMSGSDYAILADEIEASQGWSPHRLSVVNEQAANRVIADRFGVLESIIPMCAEEVGSRDFRPTKTYRMYGSGFFQKLSATGEIHHLAFSDTGFENVAETSAGMVTIPRKSIISDDIDIFAALAKAVSDTAFFTRERDFAYVLADPTLWRTATAIAPDGGKLYPNALAAGGTSTFGIAAVEELDNLLTTQKDRGGKPISQGGQRVILTQSGGMARQAKRIHNSEHVQDQVSGTAAGEPTSKANSLFGDLERRAHTQWLAHEELGDRASSTSFYLFADPAVQPMLQVVYLNDKREPTVETAKTAFNSLGQQMRGVWDYGIAQIDDIGAVYSPGE